MRRLSIYQGHVPPPTAGGLLLALSCFLFPLEIKGRGESSIKVNTFTLEGEVGQNY